MEEKILWKGMKSRKALLRYYLIGIIFLGLDLVLFVGLLNSLFPTIPLPDYLYYVLAGTGITLILAGELKRILIKYSVTETRIIKEEGIFNKHMDYIPYQMIERISSVVKWYERIFKTGSIKVDTGEDNFWIKSVSHPERVEKMINGALSVNMRRYYGDQRAYQSRSGARRRV